MGFLTTIVALVTILNLIIAALKNIQEMYYKHKEHHSKNE